jgi:hypothetical protein
MSRRLLLLNLVLVTAGVVFSAHIVRTLLASSSLPALPAVTAPSAGRAPTGESASQARPLASYDVIAARSLFNPGRSETGTASIAPVSKPLLYGVVLRDGTREAFLEDPVTKKVLAYRPGDQVAGGQLERIEADRVVIRRGEGTFEVLLRDPQKPKAVAAAQPAPPAAQPPPPSVRPQVQPAPTPGAPAQPPATLFRRPQAPAVPPVRNAPSP